MAKVAGMPKQVLDRATQIMLKLEKSHGAQEMSHKTKELAEEERNAIKLL